MIRFVALSVTPPAGLALRNWCFNLLDQDGQAVLLPEKVLLHLTHSKRDEFTETANRIMCNVTAGVAYLQATPHDAIDAPSEASVCAVSSGRQRWVI
jgi:hypothetical protein